MSNELLKRFVPIVLALGLTLVAASQSEADVITYSSSQNFAPFTGVAGGTTNLFFTTIPAFNPSLGTLTGVDIQLQESLQVSAVGSAPSQPFSGGFSASVISSTTISTNIPFDGGALGMNPNSLTINATYAGQVLNGVSSGMLRGGFGTEDGTVSGPVNLRTDQNFFGPYQAPVEVSVFSLGRFQTDVGIVISSLSTSGNVALNTTYTYTPASVPEPTTLTLTAAGGVTSFALLAFRKSKRGKSVATRVA